MHFTRFTFFKHTKFLCAAAEVKLYSVFKRLNFIAINVMINTILHNEKTSLKQNQKLYIVLYIE